MSLFQSKEVQIIAKNLKEPKKFYLGIFIALLVAIIESIIPYIYGHLVDMVLQPNFQILLVVKIIVFWLTISVVAVFLNRYSNRCSYEVAIDLSNNLLIDLYHHLLCLPMRFHKEKKTGKVLRQIDRGVDQVSNVIESTVFHFIPTILSFMIAVVVLMATEWHLAAILLFASIVYVLITIAYTKKIIKRQKKLHQAWEKAYGDLYDSVYNVQTVKTNTNEEFEKKRHTKNFERAGRVYKNWRYVWEQMIVWQRVVFSVSFVAIFAFGIFMLSSNHLTPGNLIMFVGYVGLLTEPLSRLADQYRSIKSASTAFRRAIQIYSVAPEKDKPDAIELPDLKGKIVFDHVTFGYRKDRLILKDISFKIEPGETAAFIGASGVGKTTIIDLVGRYILPLKGKITIDDVDIGKLKLEFLRSKMALVPQEVMLFNDTIINNIRYGNPGVTDKEIIEVCKVANASEFIEKFPQKYYQIVGEKGIKLSTGQKQRIAIARALIRNPRILILDEATSALDSVSEKLVQDALQRLIKGRTTLVVAHRLSTIQQADKIIVLANGRIAEMGTHEKLMKNENGVYRNFWELQSAIQKTK